MSLGMLNKSIFKAIFLFPYFIFCVWLFFLHVFMCTMYVPGAQRGQRRVWDPLELELAMVVSRNVGAKNQT